LCSLSFLCVLANAHEIVREQQADPHPQPKESPGAMHKKLARASALFTIVVYAWVAPLRASALPLPPPPGASLIVTVTSPVAGSTNTGTVAVAAGVSVVGSLTVAGVQFKRDGINIGNEDTASPYSVLWNTTTATNGSHTVTAVARDVLGVLWTSRPVTVTVSNDVTRPTVTINQAAGQGSPTSSSPINFTAVFSEAVSGFGGADVTIGGTAGGIKTAAVSGGPSTYTVAVSGMTGSGTVIATIAAGVARDAAGNTNIASTSADNQVVFDSTPPAPPSAPDLTAASDSGVSDTDDLTSVTTPTFTGTAETESTVNIFSDGVQVGTGTARGGTYAIATSSLGDGVHSITATATDDAKNISSPSPPLSVKINSTRPAVAVTSPADRATVSGTETVTATASDDIAVTGVQFLLDGVAGTTVTATPYSAPWDTTTVTNGPHTLTAIAVDAAGNRATSAPVTVTVANDTTPPTVGIDSPAAGAAVSGTIVVTATAADNIGVAGVQFLLDGNPGTEVTTAPYSASWDTTTASNGSHTLAAIARDVSGNRTTSAPVTVTVSNTVRFEELSSAVSGAPAGAWVARGAEVAAFSGASAGSSDVTGATATFTFAGTSVSWIGLRCSACGIATVTIDGGAAISVDTAGAAAPGSPGLASEVVFTASGLGAGSHTMVITVTGTTVSGGAHIVVDAFDVT
jgi:hypothetical protein